MGGSGIISLSILNKALLDKWLWRFACKSDSLWKLLIMGKKRGGLCFRGVRERYGVGVWKAIRSG